MGSDGLCAAPVEALSAALGHADRRSPFRGYCLDLLMPSERKSVDPAAAVTSPGRPASAPAAFRGSREWLDERVTSATWDQVRPSMERHGAVEARIIDDTGSAKKGRHSVGVARRYSGRLGRQDGCQVAVSRRSPAMRPAFPLPTGSTCPRTGPQTPSGTARPACPTTPPSAPSPRSGSIRSGPPCRPASRVGPC